MKYMDRKQLFRIISLITNISLFALGVTCLVYFILVPDAEESSRFMYYTNLSNLFLGIVSAISIPYIIKSIRKKEDAIPTWLSILKLVSVTATTMTAFIVITILVPATSFFSMYRDIRLVTHAISPILALVSFLVVEKHVIYRWIWSLFGSITVLVYGTIYAILVFGLGVWPDIYEFNHFGNWPLFFPAFQAVGFGIAQGLYFLKKFIQSKLLK